MIYYCTLLYGHYCDLILALFHHSVTFIGFFPVRSHELDLYVRMCVHMKKRDRDREREW